jgi:SAM-dependent methyltransferase
MLHEYKRRQMEFEDREWCRYNLKPDVLSAPYRFYFETQCEIGISELAKEGFDQQDTVLICGVGGGADLQYWLDHLRVGRYVALDFSIEAIHATQRRIRHLGRPEAVEYLKADIEDIPLQDDSVDLVIASQVLHHALDPGRACREMFRVARRGVLLLEPANTLLTPLLIYTGLARATESVGNVVLRFRKSDFISYLNGSRYSIRYRTYLFYDHQLIEKALTRCFGFPGGVTVLKGLYKAAALCLFPLRSKCAVFLQKHGPDRT